MPFIFILNKVHCFKVIGGGGDTFHPPQRTACKYSTEMKIFGSELTVYKAHVKISDDYTVCINEQTQHSRTVHTVQCTLYSLPKALKN